MSDAAWRVEFAPVAAKEFRRLDPPVRRRVLAALDRLAVGDPTLDVKRLKGGAESRLRVGDWRVRFRRDEAARLIVVGHVLPRGRAYDR